MADEWSSLLQLEHCEFPGRTARLPLIALANPNLRELSFASDHDIDKRAVSNRAEDAEDSPFRASYCGFRPRDVDRGIVGAAGLPAERSADGQTPRFDTHRTPIIFTARFSC